MYLTIPSSALIYGCRWFQMDSGFSPVEQTTSWECWMFKRGLKCILKMSARRSGAVGLSLYDILRQNMCPQISDWEAHKRNFFPCIMLLHSTQPLSLLSRAQQLLETRFRLTKGSCSLLYGLCFTDVQCGTVRWYWLVENPVICRFGTLSMFRRFAESRLMKVNA